MSMTHCKYVTVISKQGSLEMGLTLTTHNK